MSWSLWILDNCPLDWYWDWYWLSYSYRNIDWDWDWGGDGGGDGEGVCTRNSSRNYDKGINGDRYGGRKGYIDSGRDSDSDDNSDSDNDSDRVIITEIEIKIWAC